MQERHDRKIEFSKDERAAIVALIRQYFVDEMDQEIGVIPAEMLLNFLAERIGPFFYNRGLNDAHDAFRIKAEEVADAIYGLERREATLR